MRILVMNENQVAVFKKKDGKLSVGRVLSDSEVASFFPDFDATSFLAIENIFKDCS